MLRCCAAKLGKSTVAAYSFVLLGIAYVPIVEKVHGKAQQCRDDNAESHKCIQSGFADDILLAHVHTFYHTVLAIDSQKCVMTEELRRSASDHTMGETE